MTDDRIYRVLWAVVESYITNPDPVGSRFVTKKYAFNLSPATIRNIMADLEEMGFLIQPHTSAGRVPTDKGYRFYVDSLSGERALPSAYHAEEIMQNLQSLRNDINALLKEASKTLSTASHYVGVALSPRAEKTTLRGINLFVYKEGQVMAVLLTGEGIVKNKAIRVDADLTQRDLNRISDYLNSEFSGQTIDEIRSAILREMRRDKALCDTLISRAMRICREALHFDYSDVFISGFSEVLGLPDFSDLQKIKIISKAIEDRHLIIKLLDTLSQSHGVKVVIGSENPASEMRTLSMVVSSYKEGDRPIGTIGIIGPTRMDYMKAITLVDTTAKFITRVLSER
ncbi:MAG TPA: heat-inducible transcriptional repressor HrcA [Thermodesulfovibrionales bacterium]|nr:heat-inducible transcriptional repressor HrcA [Thermodesulfovibrionales bacterium]